MQLYREPEKKEFLLTLRDPFNGDWIHGGLKIVSKEAKPAKAICSKGNVVTEVKYMIHKL